ncbi:hypothetical protein C8R45DRAFT_983543 [Mycena sanguinolenta]|nr:hypothetical protein C8R45DRAFT_983543 [Mycena sanguinolenta]
MGASLPCPKTWMAVASLKSWTASLEYRDSSFRSKWARHLDSGHFQASTAVLVDDIVVLGLFSRITTKPVKRRFFPALFSMNEAPINLEAVKKFREIAETQLGTLFNTEPSVAALRNSTHLIATGLLNWGAEIMHLSGIEDGHEALVWGLQAYLALIAPWSPVRLKVVQMGVEAEPGFGVVAQRGFSVGEYIYELIGLLTPDYVEGHSELSTINCPRHQTRHVFWGPIRMVNHDCTPNVEFVEVTGRRAMVVCALRAIEVGEELLCDYGQEFWEGQCPCKTCRGPSASSAPSAQPSGQPMGLMPEQEVERERKRAEKKRERNKSRRQAGLTKKVGQ